MPPQNYKTAVLQDDPKEKEREQEIDDKLTKIHSDEVEEHARQNAHHAKIPFADLNILPVDDSALFLMEEAESAAAQAVVFARKSNDLTIAAIDPTSETTKKFIAALEAKAFTCHVVMCSPKGLAFALSRYRFKPKVSDTGHGIINIDEKKISTFREQIKSMADLKERITSLAISDVTNILIAGALKIGASDIHFEPEEHDIRLRYRLDGVLTDVVSFAREGYHEVLSRLKLTAGLKINIHNAPQDGRFTIREQSKDIEVRVSILPGAYGENIVMRILDPSSIRQKLEELGMRPDTMAQIKKLLEKTTGTILTTGPTGSGKTTTLYAFLQSINSPDVKVITIEDPIEYHIVGVSQTQVNDKAGYSFAAGLRSIVRQDPDIILVGEIRDQETAEIAMQAALTGHLVLSTIHTNSAAGTIPRLIDLGVKPVTIAPAVRAAMAQRLVRRLCLKCKTSTKATQEQLELLKKYLSELPKTLLPISLDESTQIPSAPGCDACSHVGYKGRIGVYEIFEIDGAMQKLILTNPAFIDVQELAVKNGMVTLLQDGLLKVISGITSLDEVMRVIGE